MDMTLEADLETFIHSPKPKPQVVAQLARRFLVAQGKPTDLRHALVAMKALDDVWEQEQKASSSKNHDAR